MAVSVPVAEGEVESVSVGVGIGVGIGVGVGINGSVAVAGGGKSLDLGVLRTASRYWSSVKGHVSGSLDRGTCRPDIAGLG